MAKLKRGGLGRGLDALYEDNSAAFPDEKAEDGIKMVRVSAIEPNRGQPRKEFDSESLSELADSIREHGVLQPLLVRRLPGASLEDESYQLVAGERRWRAARMAGLSEVPVVVREMSEAEVLEFALIENLQREDLNPLEEAGGYQELIDTFGLTQEEVARKVGRSRSAVANALRVLKLPQELHPYLRDGDLTAGHAKALLTVKERGKMLKLAEITIEQGLSVREVERRAARLNEASEEADLVPITHDHFYKEMQLAMQNELGRRVRINPKYGDNGGTLQINYFSKEDLQAIAQVLGQITGEKIKNQEGDEE